VKLSTKTLIISIIYLGFCITSSATTSRSNKPQKNILQITKVDSQHKGIADILILERPHTSTTLKLDGTNITQVEIQREMNGVFVNTKYKKSGSKFILFYAYATSARYFYNQDSCSMKNDNNAFSMSSLGSLTGGLESHQNISLDSTCKQFPELQKEMTSEFSKLIDSKNKDATVACILQLDTTAAGKWKSLPSSLVKFGCSSEKEKYNGIFDSKNNEIKISNSCTSNANSLSLVMKEEILHSFGIRDEELAKCIATCPSANLSSHCQKLINPTEPGKNLNNISLFVRTSSDVSLIGASGQLGGIAETQTDDYNSAKTIEVPKEIAVAQVPQPAVQDLRMTQSVETSTVTDTSGTSGAVGSSGGGRSYSASTYPNSMMQFAATAVLPEKAFAQATSPTETMASSHQSSDSSSSSHDSTSSSASLRSPSSLSSEALRHTAASRMPASNSALANPSYSTSGNPADGNSDKSANESGSSADIGKSSSAKAFQSRNGRASGNTGGTSSVSANGDSQGNSSASNSSSVVGARSPASVRSFATSTPTNLVQYFQSAPYKEIKQRLRDPKFIQDLKKNSTTVFDTQGHQFGAEQGQIIYSDKGNRFVKEK